MDGIYITWVAPSMGSFPAPRRQDVLGFQVPMHHILVVDELQPRGRLLGDALHHILRLRRSPKRNDIRFKARLVVKGLDRSAI